MRTRNRNTRLGAMALALYGMAELYRWVPSGEWEGSQGEVDLPKSIPYRWYC